MNRSITSCSVWRLFALIMSDFFFKGCCCFLFVCFLPQSTGLPNAHHHIDPHFDCINNLHSLINIINTSCSVIACIEYSAQCSTTSARCEWVVGYNTEGGRSLNEQDVEKGRGYTTLVVVDFSVSNVWKIGGSTILREAIFNVSKALGES